MEEYVPIDTSKIKQSKIRTEKDLEKEILDIWHMTNSQIHDNIWLERKNQSNRDYSKYYTYWTMNWITFISQINWKTSKTSDKPTYGFKISCN